MDKNQLISQGKIERFSRNNFEELHSCLLKLSSKKQLAIQMRFFDELEIDRMSQVLGMTWDDTDMLIENALIELRIRLEKKLDKLPAGRAA